MIDFENELERHFHLQARTVNIMSMSRTLFSCSLWSIPRRLLFFVLAFLLSSCTHASIPNLQLSIDDDDGTEHLFLKRASFGPQERVVSVEGTLRLAPLSPQLCELPQNFTLPTEQEDFILLVYRGNCPFERKARHAQQLGAQAVLIVDTLSARYQWNDAAQRVIFPSNELDYECDNGRGSILDLYLDPPQYYAEELDSLLDMTSNQSQCELDRECDDSQLCLVTGHVAGSNLYPVCCAWDTHITMPQEENSTSTDESIEILSAFATIRQGQQLQQLLLMMDDTTTTTQVTLQNRPRSLFNVSMVFMWMLACGITFTGSYLSTKPYRAFGAKLMQIQGERRQSQNQDAAEEEQQQQEEEDHVELAENPDRQQRDHPPMAVPSSEQVEEAQVVSPRREQDDRDAEHCDVEAALPTPAEEEEKEDPEEDDTWETLRSIPPSSASNSNDNEDNSTMVLYQRRRSSRLTGQTTRSSSAPQSTTTETSSTQQPQPPTFAIQTKHVIIFCIVASTLLVLLYFFDVLFQVVTVLYGICASGAAAYWIFGPFLVYTVPKCGDAMVELMNERLVFHLNGFDVVSQATALLWSVIWIYMAFTTYQPSTRNAFVWTSLNIFGACICLTMLTLFQLNTLKISVLFMVAIFIYDVFFVFVTPLIWPSGESVMIVVAQGGSSDGQESLEDYCYKYPTSPDCVGMDILPMVLSVPRVNDWMKSGILLGLGDIVLPGFLLAYAARYDQARRILGHVTDTWSNDITKWYHGYFPPLCVAYAVGLILAFVAVILMEQGQPALLYLVPCCLGTLILVARKELGVLWRNDETAIVQLERLRIKCERSWRKQANRKRVRQSQILTQEQQQPSELRRAGLRSRRSRSHSLGRSRSHSLSRSNSDGSLSSQRPQNAGASRNNLNGHRNPPQQQFRRTMSDGSIQHSINMNMTTVSPGTRTSPSTRRVQQQSRASSAPSLPPPQTSSSSTDNNHTLLPKAPKASTRHLMSRDVLLGEQSHPGTQLFLKAILRAVQRSTDGEWNTTVCQEILNEIAPARFFRSSMSTQDLSSESGRGEQQRRRTKIILPVTSQAEIESEMERVFQDCRRHAAKKKKKRQEAPEEHSESNGQE